MWVNIKKTGCTLLCSPNYSVLFFFAYFTTTFLPLTMYRPFWALITRWPAML